MIRNDKPTKKQLKKQAARLAERLDELSGRIDVRAFRSTKQSSQISELRAQLAELVSDQDTKLQDLGSRLDSLASDDQDLEGKTDNLTAHIRGLEESISTLERAELELRERTLSLETSAAELSRHQSRLVELTERLDRNDKGTPVIRQELARVFEHVRGLAAQTDHLASAVQELDTARARHEQSGEDLETRAQTLETRLDEFSNGGTAVAEMTDRLEKATGIAASLAAEVAALSSRSRTLERKTEDLVDLVHELQNRSSERSRVDSELNERTLRLETTAAELTTEQTRLRERADQLGARTETLEQSVASDRTQTLAQEIEQLGERAKRTDAKTESLEARLADDRSGTDRELQRLQQRTGDLEQRVHGLATSSGGVGDEMASLTQRIESIASESRQLATTQTSLADHAVSLDSAIDELSRQTLALAEDLQVLRPEFQGALGERLDKLRHELQDLVGERLRDQAQETDHVLDELGADTSRLDNEAQVLRTQTQDLQQRVRRLDELERELALRADSLSTHGDAVERRLVELRSAEARLSGETDALKQTQMAHEQVIAASHIAHQEQAGEQQALTSTTNRLASDLAALTDQASRHDETENALDQRLGDTERLQQQHTADLGELSAGVRSRTRVAAVAVLILAGGLIGLHFYQYGSPKTEGELAASASQVRGLEIRQQELDTKLEDLSAGLYQFEETVDDINGAVSAADAKADQVFSRHVEDFAQVNEAVDALKSQRQTEQRLTADVASLQATVKKIQEGLFAAESPRAWARAKEQGDYTLQVLGVRNRRSLSRFARKHRIDGQNSVCRTQYQGRDWYILLHGIYGSPRQAREALEQLPAELAELKPWVRRIPPDGELLPLE